MSFTSDIPAQANQLELSVEIPPVDSSHFNDFFTTTYKRIASAMNTKEGALYVPMEVATFQQWFTVGNPQAFRTGYRTVVNMGNCSVPIAHNIPSFTIMTHIYGGAVTVTPTYLPVPYASITALDDQIEVLVDATNVTVLVGAGVPAVTSCYVVLHYLKS